MGFFRKLFSRYFHTMHVGAHLSYFALVFVESHGLYGVAAGVLFVLTIVGIFVPEDEIDDI